MNRLPECPGPCNPKNRTLCRRACAQHVATLLEELPPCIRARLCAEDVAALCGNGVRESKSPPAAYRDVSTSSKELEKRVKTPVEEPTTKKPSATSKQDGISNLESNASTYVSSNASSSGWSNIDATIGTTCQTNADKEADKIGVRRAQETQETQTPETESYAIAQRLESIRARAAHVSVALKNVMSRLSWLMRILGITSTGCSCRTINTLLYTGLLLFMSRFARNTSFYEVFLSSQICGVIVVLCWKISGRVPI